jgi:hypothetical protein
MLTYVAIILREFLANRKRFIFLNLPQWSPPPLPLPPNNNGRRKISFLIDYFLQVTEWRRGSWNWRNSVTRHT